MTLPELLNRISHLKGWFLTRHGEIRRNGKNGVQCPITALDPDCNLYQTDTVADELGIRESLRQRVIGASDNAPKMDQRLRRNLLKATKLK